MDADVAEFDIVVLGGGSGSQVATAAADAGLEAAVCEPGPLGGACVTRGCVPSKALLHRAEIVEEVRRAERFGIDAAVRDVDVSAITDAIHDAVYEKADRQRESLEETENLALYEAAGRFVDERTIALDSRDDGEGDGEGENATRIRGDHVVIAVGGRPTTPPIDGLEDVDFLTSDDALFLDSRPEDLVIVGGGYIAAELGYFFGALGTDVSIVGRSDALVSREDEDVSRAVTRSLERRLDVYAGHEATGVSSDGDGVAVDAESSDGEKLRLEAEELLVAAGRRPNTDTLDLENAGVETDEKGHVEVDESLETSVENVWAVGDVLAAQPFKHVADCEARVVTRNVLDDAGATVDYAGIPHAIFTSPQVASVGRTEAELEEEGREYESTLVSYDAAPMGMILEGERRPERGGRDPERFVKVLAGADGEILGCHVVGPQASTMIHEVAVAIQRGSGTVDELADTVHVHPALNEVVLKAFDEAAARPYSTAPDWRETAERGGGE